MPYKELSNKELNRVKEIYKNIHKSKSNKNSDEFKKYVYEAEIMVCSAYGLEAKSIGIVSPAIKTKFEKIVDKRISIASLIIDSIPNTGRTKLEKIFYLIDQEIEDDLKTTYCKEAAGPLDQRALYNRKWGIEFMAEKEKIFKAKESFIKKSNRKYKQVKYIPLDCFKKYISDSRKLFSNKDEETINRIIRLLSNFDLVRCEIIATLYACWNDLIIKKKSFKDEDIIKAFFSWSSKKRKIYFYHTKRVRGKK